MLICYDSTTVADIPDGADAYAGYTSGNWPTWPEIQARFAGKHLLSIAVSAAHDADVLDIENGDATPAQAPAWVKRQMARGIVRPVVYSSQSQMPSVLTALAATGITRDQVRVWTAHYTAQHVCSPDACKANGFTADGTQWADTGPNGEHYDRSILSDDFFGDDVALTADDLESINEAIFNNLLTNVIRGAEFKGMVQTQAKAAIAAEIPAIAKAVAAAIPKGAGTITEADVVTAVKSVLAQAAK